MTDEKPMFMTTGNPRFFLKIIEPQGDDLVHAQKVIEHWRPNFEMVDFEKRDES